MNTSFAKFLSYVMHPLLMPFYAVLVVMNLNTYISYSISPQVQIIITTLVFITTGALPVITAVILLQKGIITSLEMDSVRERRLPFITTALFYAVCYYLLKQLPVPRLLSLMVLAATVSILIAWALSYRWKVSIHLIGIGGFTGILYGLSQVLNAGLINLIVIAVVLSGLLGSARLKLGAHSPAQVYTGFLIGFFVEWLTIALLSN